MSERPCRFDTAGALGRLREVLGEEHPAIWSCVTLGDLLGNLAALRAAADDPSADVRAMLLDLCDLYTIEGTAPPARESS